MDYTINYIGCVSGVGVGCEGMCTWVSKAGPISVTWARVCVCMCVFQLASLLIPFGGRDPTKQWRTPQTKATRPGLGGTGIRHCIWSRINNGVAALRGVPTNTHLTLDYIVTEKKRTGWEEISVFASRILWNSCCAPATRNHLHCHLWSFITLNDYLWAYMCNCMLNETNEIY